jgi:hypothetical protein
MYFSSDNTGVTILTDPDQSGTGIYILDIDNKFGVVNNGRLSTIVDSVGGFTPSMASLAQNVGGPAGSVAKALIMSGAPLVVPSAYEPIGSSGTTLTVASTSGIIVGMVIIGAGFDSRQTVTAVDGDGVTLTISAPPDSTPSGTLYFNLVIPYKAGRAGALITTQDARSSLTGEGAEFEVYTVPGILGGYVYQVRINKLGSGYVGPVTKTYNPTGSSGTTLKVNNTTNILPGMSLTGTGFNTAQTVVTVDDINTLTLSNGPDLGVTPSGTLTFTHTVTLYGEFLGGVTGPTNNMVLAITPTAEQYWKNMYVGDINIKNRGTAGGPVGWTLLGGVDGLYVVNPETGDKYLINMTPYTDGDLTVAPNILGV